MMKASVAWSRLGDAVILISILLALSFVFPLSRSTFPYLMIAALLLLGFSIITGNPHAVHIALFTFFIPLSVLFWPRVWPFHLLGPLLPYSVIVLAASPLRRTVYWLKEGRLGTKVKVLMGITVVLSALGLMLWFKYLRPDLTMHLAKIPLRSPGMLVAAGIGFGLVNAAIEENIFRGLLMQSLQSVFSRGAVVVVIQGLAFGLIHLKGIPNGWIGFLMASAYGCMQGVLRRLSGGILAPYLTHVCLDTLIFYVLAFWLAGK